MTRNLVRRQPHINYIDLRCDWDGNPDSSITADMEIEFVSEPNSWLPVVDVSNSRIKSLEYSLSSRVEVGGTRRSSDPWLAHDSQLDGANLRDLTRYLHQYSEEYSDGQGNPRKLYSKRMGLAEPSNRTRMFDSSPVSLGNRGRLSYLARGVAGLRTWDQGIGCGGNGDDDDNDHGFLDAETNLEEGTWRRLFIQDDLAVELPNDQVKREPPERDLPKYSFGFRRHGPSGETANMSPPSCSTPATSCYERGSSANRLSNSSALQTPSSPLVLAVSKRDSRSPSGCKRHVSRIPVKVATSTSMRQHDSVSVKLPGFDDQYKCPRTSASKTGTKGAISSDGRPLAPTISPVLTPKTLKRFASPPPKTPQLSTHTNMNQKALSEPRKLRQNVNLLGLCLPPQASWSRHATKSVSGLPSCLSFDDYVDRHAGAGNKRNARSGSGSDERPSFGISWIQDHGIDRVEPAIESRPQPGRCIPSPVAALTGLKVEAAGLDGRSELIKGEEVSPGRRDSRDLVGLSNGSLSSWFLMPWDSAETLANDREKSLSLVMAQDTAIRGTPRMEDTNGIFSVRLPWNARKGTLKLAIRFELRLEPARPGGWQILMVPGLPLQSYGGKGTFTLTGSGKVGRRIVEFNTGALSNPIIKERDIAGDFDLARGLVLPIRTSLPTSHLLQAGFKMDYELQVLYDINCGPPDGHRGLGIEYVAVCALTLEQKCFWAEKCAFVIVISDGPEGEFEWLNYGEREFRLDFEKGHPMGSTEIKITCPTPDLEKVFRIVWRLNYEAMPAKAWVPKLHFAALCHPAISQRSDLRTSARNEDSEIQPQKKTYEAAGCAGLEIQSDGKSVTENEDQERYDVFGFRCLVNPLPALGSASIWIALLLYPVYVLMTVPIWILRSSIRTLRLEGTPRIKHGNIVSCVKLGGLASIVLLVLGFHSQAMPFVGDLMNRPTCMEGHWRGFPSSLSDQCRGLVADGLSWLARQKTLMMERGFFQSICSAVHGPTTVADGSPRSRITVSVNGETNSESNHGGIVEKEAAMQAVITREMSSGDGPLTLPSLVDGENSEEPQIDGGSGVDITKPSVRDRIDWVLGWQGPMR